MDDIRDMFGSQRYEQKKEEEKKLQAVVYGWGAKCSLNLYSHPPSLAFLATFLLFLLD